MVGPSTPRSVTRGTLMVAAGATLLAGEAVILKLAGLDTWQVVFWRGGFVALSLCAFLLATGRLAEFKPLAKANGRDWLIVAVFCLNALLFAFAITLTNVANAIFLLSTTPVFALIASRLLLHEPITRASAVAIGLALVGSGCVFFGALDGERWVGSVFALLFAASTGWLLTLLRQHPKAHRIPAIATGALLAGLISLPWALPLRLHPVDIAWMALAGCLLKPVSSVLNLSATRYITAPHAGLVLLLEVALAPLFAWLILNETLNGRTLIGGGFIATAVFSHFWLARQQGDAPTDHNHD